MKILRLKSNSKFRGLLSGIELNFRLDNYTPDDIREPICLVGLNGSGKSNTLQTICEIFYYLELLTISSAKEIEALENRYANLHFEIDYLISPSKWKYASGRSIDKLSINEDDHVTIQCVKTNGNPAQIFVTSESRGSQSIALPKVLWPEVLPTRVVGYSSGQNELISNAFIKLNFHYFDEFEKRTGETSLGSLDVNRMFFMDYESNELVVLSNFLFEQTSDVNNHVKGYRNKLRIKNLRSFSIRLRFKDYKGDLVEIPSDLNLGIERLKRCASLSMDTDEGNILSEKEKKNRTIDLLFYADDAVKSAFRSIFKTSYELFKLLYSLRLLNIHCISAKTRTSIKQAPQGTNLSDLLPKPSIEDLIFKIEGINFVKSQGSDPIYYKQLSDGEHQLLHVMGTLQLMNESDSLFILDEPETHFNPEWRSKMVDMIVRSNQSDDQMKDYFITSHSPFIISDCKPNNVYIFNKNEKDEIKVETAAKRRLNTFGTSVNILTEEVFNKHESIADYSLRKLNEIKNRSFKNLKDIETAKEDARVLGESVEKTLLFRKLLIIEDQIVGSSTAKKKKSKSKKSILKPKKTIQRKKQPVKKAAPKKKATKSSKSKSSGKSKRKR